MVTFYDRDVLMGKTIQIIDPVKRSIFHCNLSIPQTLSRERLCNDVLTKAISGELLAEVST
jgi:hypothetical protein